ncbi:MAG TPA: CBS domain-containing protein [Candidatus Nanoarchaeia archaeon]|nr:CBS domain-containing protein [Candidatus Nanoarchaeia archaeon]
MERKHISQVVVCREGDKVLEVCRILRDTQQRHLIVVNAKDFPVGVISTVDTNNRVLAEAKDPTKCTAGEIMTKNIKCVSLEETYEKAFTIMAQHGLTAIPVIHQERLIGQLEFSHAFKLKEIKEMKK